MCFAPQRCAIFHLSSAQRAPNHWKNAVFRDFPTFSRAWIFFLLRLSLSSSLLLADSSHLCFSSVHIVGNLTSKLPSARKLVHYGCSICMDFDSALIDYFFAASQAPTGRWEQFGTSPPTPTASFAWVALRSRQALWRTAPTPTGPTRTQPTSLCTTGSRNCRPSWDGYLDGICGKPG